jgi:hypothetical protein
MVWLQSVREIIEIVLLAGGSVGNVQEAAGSLGSFG